MRRTGTLLALMLVAACAPGSNPVDDLGGRRGARDAIINGQETSDYPAVVMLMVQGQVFCSGTLIAPRKVLTAGHCATGQAMADAIGIGASDQQIDQEIAVVSSTPHPQYDANTLANDVAVVTLAEDAPIAPAVLNQAMDDSWVGTPMLLVGYGVDDGAAQTGAGTKRMVEIPIGQLTSTHVLYDEPSGKSACNGDSGGPMLLDQNGSLTVVAVASYVNVQGCTQGGGHSRVDAFLDFIQGEMDPNAPPPDPNDPNNQPPDPNDPNAWPPDPNDPNQADPGDACGGITYEGTCDGDVAVWCEDGELWGYACEPGACGLDPSSGLYDCLE